MSEEAPATSVAHHVPPVGNGSTGVRDSGCKLYGTGSNSYDNEVFDGFFFAGPGI